MTSRPYQRNRRHGRGSDAAKLKECPAGGTTSVRVRVVNFHTYGANMKPAIARSTVLLLAATAGLAQDIQIPATDGSIPEPGDNGCAPGYYPASNTITYTVPYTYDQVLSIIGNFTNLTWSGSPPNSVTTNNTAALETNLWTPGTSRTYDLNGAHVIETITTYMKPASGPYIEVHTVAPLTVPSADVSLYSDYDAQAWWPVCGGKATWTNFTISFCATNVTAGTEVLSALHMSDAVNVGKMLGGDMFTSCEAMGVNATQTVSGSYIRTVASSIGTVARYSSTMQTVATSAPASVSGTLAASGTMGSSAAASATGTSAASGSSSAKASSSSGAAAGQGGSGSATSATSTPKYTSYVTYPNGGSTNDHNTVTVIAAVMAVAVAWLNF